MCHWGLTNAGAIDRSALRVVPHRSTARPEYTGDLPSISPPKNRRLVPCFAMTSSRSAHARVCTGLSSRHSHRQ